MGEAHGEFGPMPTMFYVYMDDVDGSYQRALAAGAVSQEAPALQPYGERRAAVRDPSGNQWYLASPSR
jgi:PhnB protein